MHAFIVVSKGLIVRIDKPEDLPIPSEPAEQRYVSPPVPPGTTGDWPQVGWLWNNGSPRPLAEGEVPPEQVSETPLDAPATPQTGTPPAAMQPAPAAESKAKT